MQEVNWSLLTRYLRGECSEGEWHQVEKWMRERPERRRLVQEVKQLWRLASSPRVDVPPPGRYMESDWERLRANMESAEAEPEEARSGREAEDKPLVGKPSGDRPPLSSPRPAARRKKRHTQRNRSGVWASRMLGVAAVVLVALGGALLLSQGALGLFPAQDVQREAITKAGQQAQLTLSDGTRVRLNVDSKLQYPRSFDGERREVHLTGEAHFDVTSDSTRPFIVHANGASVRVRGTAFGVRAYRERDVRVVVAEGAVDLGVETLGGGTQDAVSLSRNDMGQVIEGELQAAVEGVDPSLYLSWQEGRLVFEDTPFQDVADGLERWYDLSIRIEDPELARRRLTASFKEEPPEAVLEVIATALEASYSRDGAEVTFSLSE